MIHYFRRIRHALLQDSKIRKYMLYALGEIALVMIGILLALQINTWNTNRLDREEEQFIYQRLIQDLEQDIAGLELSISNFENRLIYGVEALDQLKSTNADQVRSWQTYTKANENNPNLIKSRNLAFGELLFRILVINLFYLTDNTFQELISSGKIDIIRDQELKTSIQSYYPKMKRHQSFQDNIIFTVQSKYRDALDRNKISYLNKQSLEELVITGMDKKDIEASIENLLSLTGGSLNDENTTGLVTMKSQVEELLDKIKSKIKS